MGHLHQEALEIAAMNVVLREVVDGGANEGHISSQILRQYPGARVHAFEPHPKVFPMLEKNLAPFGSRAILHQKALGASPGQMKLNLAQPSAASSIFQRSERWKDLYQQVKGFDNSTEVEVVNLDSYWRGWELDRIDFLKLDTQGFELAILIGAEELLAEHRIEYILAEVFFTPFYEKAPLGGDVLTMLADEFGYYPVKIWPDPASRDWVRHADILFTYRRDA